MKREANFQIVFNHWLKNVWKQTGAFELKQTTTNSISFACVQDHQLAALENVHHGVLVYKIPDVGYQNPFDCFCLVTEPAFIVVKFPKFFCLIEVVHWIAYQTQSSRKSLTSKEAREISTVIVDL